MKNLAILFLCCALYGCAYVQLGDGPTIKYAKAWDMEDGHCFAVAYGVAQTWRQAHGGQVGIVYSGDHMQAVVVENGMRRPLGRLGRPSFGFAAWEMDATGALNFVEIKKDTTPGEALSGL